MSFIRRMISDGSYGTWLGGGFDSIMMHALCNIPLQFVTLGLRRTKGAVCLNIHILLPMSWGVCSLSRVILNNNCLFVRFISLTNMSRSAAETKKTVGQYLR